jgi:hypothetical protein
MANNGAGNKQSSASVLLTSLLSNGEPVASVVALAFDLECVDELAEALQQLAVTRQLEAERKTQLLFPELSRAVETALDHTSSLELATRTMSEAKQAMDLLQKAREHAQHALLAAKRSVQTCEEELRANAEFRAWAGLARDAAADPNPVSALERLLLLERLTKSRAETLALDLHAYASRRIVLLREATDKGLVDWATRAAGADKDLGHALLGSGARQAAPDSPALLRQVQEFFTVHQLVGQAEPAFETYRDMRLPALLLARRALQTSRHVASVRDAVQSIAGFFALESRKACPGFSRGELGELWAGAAAELETCLVRGAGPGGGLGAEAAVLTRHCGGGVRGQEGLLTGEDAEVLAKDPDGVIALFRDVANMPVKAARLKVLLEAKRDLLRTSLLVRAAQIPVKDDAPTRPSNEFYDAAFEFGFEKSPDGTYAFASVVPRVLANLQQTLREAVALQRKFGAFSVPADAARRAAAQSVEDAGFELALDCARITASKLLATAESEPWHVVTTSRLCEDALGRCLQRALGGAARPAPRVFEDAFRAGLNRAVAEAGARVDRVLAEEQYLRSDWAPDLTGFRAEPSAAVLALVDDLVAMQAREGFRALPGDVRARVRAECTARIEAKMMQVLTSRPINPFGVKRAALDLEVCRDWDALPRASALVRLFAVEGALEQFCRAPRPLPEQLSQDLAMCLQVFREIDPSSRLFLKPDTKRLVVDLRQAQVRQALVALAGGKTL